MKAINKHLMRKFKKVLDKWKKTRTEVKDIESQKVRTNTFRAINKNLRRAK